MVASPHAVSTLTLYPRSTQFPHSAVAPPSRPLLPSRRRGFIHPTPCAADRRATSPFGRGSPSRVPVRLKWWTRMRPSHCHGLLLQRGRGCRTACGGALGTRAPGRDQRQLDDARAHRGGHGRHSRGGGAASGHRAAHCADAESGWSHSRQLQMWNCGRRRQQAVAGAGLVGSRLAANPRAHLVQWGNRPAPPHRGSRTPLPPPVLKPTGELALVTSST